MYEDLTIVIPAKNEVQGLMKIVPQIKKLGVRVIVVSDGSTDGSLAYLDAQQIRVVNHTRSKGNGAAVKAGIKGVDTQYVGIMDGDGQHSVDELLRLYQEIKNEDYDLVVGARNSQGQANVMRWFANAAYNCLASIMVNRDVKDLTSGQRIFKTNKIKSILSLLPNSFSYPTTSTMLFYRLGHDVGFLPINVESRIGESHINLLRDGFRFFLIIMKIGTLYSPFKLFVPISLTFFLLGLARYAYTFLTFGTFTNMSALLFVSSVVVFLMGVVSEQISLSVVSRIDDVD